MIGLSGKNKRAQPPVFVHVKSLVGYNIAGAAAHRGGPDRPIAALEPAPAVVVLPRTGALKKAARHVKTPAGRTGRACIG